MPAPPLTHHEILELVEPFTRAGRQVDLAASDRIERKIVFKPRERSDEGPGAPVLRETLRLEADGDGSFRLTRELARDDAPAATLEASGPQPAELLARIDGVAAQQHFRSGAGFVAARSYALESNSGRAGQGGPARLVLRRGVARIDGLTLTLTVPKVRRVAVEITLVTGAGDTLDLPEDLLAVIGWDWARLMRTGEGWKSRLRLRGGAPRRTRLAEAALERAAGHLARVLGEPPQNYHDRLRGARWGVVLRRAIPTLTAGGMIVGAMLLPRFDIAVTTGLGLALHYGSIALLAMSFSLQELPQFEVPPLPRRSRAAGWRALPAPEPGPARAQGAGTG
jgi:hypothetical protein